MFKKGHRGHLVVSLISTGLIAGAAAALMSAPALGNSSQSKTSAGEDVFKTLFGKKRATSTDQKRARVNTTVMGIRGLDDDPDAAVKANATANMRAVYEMEDRQPNATVVQTLRRQISSGITADARKQLPVPVAAESANLAELEAEIDLGRKMSAQVLGANQIFSNKKVHDYLSSLIQVLAETGLTAERPYRISVLNSPTINAFACPGGYIFVTLGALKSTQSEAQLAALLGHEMVHVSRRHLLTSLQKKINSKKDPAQKTDHVDPHVKARKRVKPESATESSAWTQILGPKGVGLTLLQASSEALDTLLSRGLEKEFEFEADRLGQQLSSAAGYSSDSLTTLLNIMKSKSEPARASSAGTHPPYDIRIQNINEFLSTMNGRTLAVLQSSKIYTEVQREWVVE
jgi:predicted Zn-dependent protease